MEAEVVAMTAALLGSKEKSSGGQICGNMTSGGTESILLAVKTTRDYMRSKKGITKPEMWDNVWFSRQVPFSFESSTTSCLYGKKRLLYTG